MIERDCGSCDATIIWAKTLLGRNMPLDVNPDPDKGTMLLTKDGYAIGLSGLSETARASAKKVGVKLYVSHFATCPNAAQHRKERSADANRST